MNYEQTAYTIEDTLELFDAPAVCTECCVGATVTTFKLDPRFRIVDNEQIVNPRPTKLGKIQALAPDLQLALKAKSIRIEPLNGSGLIGVEIPNENRKPVLLKKIIPHLSGLKIAIGKDTYGNVVVEDIRDAVHMLCAGASGSGKSVFLNAAVSTLILNNKPDDLRLVLVDPKRVEFSFYKDAPHLLIPVITDVDEAADAFDVIVKEMERRYKVLESAGARNIEGYNDKADSKLPYIVAFVDELSDIMLQRRDDVEPKIVRVAQLGRACGTHLILSSQRATVNTFTGLIKANISHRVAFATASQVDSRVIIDQNGCENLIGRGDMLYMNNAGVKRVQGPFITDDEVKSIVEYKKKVDKIER